MNGFVTSLKDPLNAVAAELPRRKSCENVGKEFWKFMKSEANDGIRNS
jgi:hypothetical protein